MLQTAKTAVTHTDTWKLQNMKNIRKSNYWAWSILQYLPCLTLGPPYFMNLYQHFLPLSARITSEDKILHPILLLAQYLQPKRHITKSVYFNFRIQTQYLNALNIKYVPNYLIFRLIVMYYEQYIIDSVKLNTCNFILSDFKIKSIFVELLCLRRKGCKNLNSIKHFNARFKSLSGPNSFTTTKRKSLGYFQSLDFHYMVPGYIQKGYFGNNNVG